MSDTVTSSHIVCPKCLYRCRTQISQDQSNGDNSLRWSCTKCDYWFDVVEHINITYDCPPPLKIECSASEAQILFTPESLEIYRARLATQGRREC